MQKVKPFLIILILSFLTTTTFFILKNPGVRRVFFFKNRLNGTTATEIRYLPRKTVQGKYNHFIDELLLGPIDGNLAPLFSQNTRVDFCFLRKGVLYLNLTKEAVWEGNDAIPVKNACELLVKNIKKNFPSIKEVALFIDGNFIEE